jgi:hypothetical protein
LRILKTRIFSLEGLDSKSVICPSGRVLPVITGLDPVIHFLDFVKLDRSPGMTGGKKHRHSGAREARTRNLVRERPIAIPGSLALRAPTDVQLHIGE